MCKPLICVAAAAATALLGTSPAAAGEWCKFLTLDQPFKIGRLFGHKAHKTPLPAVPLTPAELTPGPVLVPPPPGPVLTPPVIAPVVPALTLRQFAATFQPAPGHYEVFLVHPVTGCPVKVCFTLPPGCPKKVRVHKRSLEFDYGRCEVQINFDRRGGVRVEYD